MAEMSVSEITKIEKLNGRNYQSWKYNVKLVLMERGLWGFTQEGQETPPAADASAAVKNAFRLRSDKAYSLIALNVEKDLSVTDPLPVWKILQKQFEFVSVTQFCAASIKESHDNFLTSLSAGGVDDLGGEKVKGFSIEEYMKRTEKNEKQESDNVLFTREKSSYRGRFQPRGGASGGRGGRFQNFNLIKCSGQP